MKRKELLDKIREIAQNCKTSTEITSLHNSAPENSAAKKIFRDRWEQISFKEALANLMKMLTLDELQQYAWSIPDDFSARGLYEAELKRRRIDRAHTNALLCERSEEAKKWYASTSIPEVLEIYKAKWYELLLNEAVERLPQITSEPLAKNFCNITPADSEAFKLYDEKWMEFYIKRNKVIK